MSTLTVSILQADLAWHDVKTNLARFSESIDSIGQKTDLIVLPEMFTTGFTMDAAANAEKMNGVSMECMAQWAARSNAAVCGSLIIKDEARYFNRFVFMRPNGKFEVYDKRHLFRLAGEVEHYSAGDRQIVVEWREWRICPMVCYDLRFPVWSRNRPDLNYDLLLYVANWPSRRHHAWRTLLRARAIENLCYLAGVNRVGTDGNELPYAGGSAIIDYLGHDLVDLGDGVGIASATLDKALLNKFRQKFPFHIDADSFSIHRESDT
ncbi:MAG: amidohydrolase [Gammaproteobacteria bacterium]|nr:amidohydrolase [Gammaproteobacteria bacterium]